MRRALCAGHRGEEEALDRRPHRAVRVEQDGLRRADPRRVPVRQAGVQSGPNLYSPYVPSASIPKRNHKDSVGKRHGIIRCKTPIRWDRSSSRIVAFRGTSNEILGLLWLCSN